MTDELLRQVIIQAPAVAILLYLLIRLDQRVGELIKVICDLAERSDVFQATERLRNLR